MATTYQAIASIISTGTTATITFSSIPSTYTDLVIRTSARSASVSASDQINIVFNGDTATNYSMTQVYGNNSAAASFRTTSATQGRINYIDVSGQTANTFGIGDIYIPNYANTTTKQVLGLSASESNDTTTSFIAGIGALYRGTSAISSITLQSAGSNYVSGSRFDLYGITHF